MVTKSAVWLGDLQAIYLAKGYIVMASVERCEPGPLTRNDWNEEEMSEFRWSVIGDSSREEMTEQNLATNWSNNIEPQFRYFYRVVALD